MPLSIAQDVTVASEAPAAQNTNMAASPQPILEQDSVASAVPVAANDLAAATDDDQETVTAAENQASDVPAATEAVIDGAEETEGLTVVDAVASTTPVDEGVLESAVTDATVLVAAAAADGETGTLSPAADVIINVVATDATVAQTVPIQDETVETVNEATANQVLADAAVITDTATGEHASFIAY